MRKNGVKQTGFIFALLLGLFICLAQSMSTAQAKTSSDNTPASSNVVDPSKTISFSTTISGINLTSTISASLSCPSSIDAGDSGTGTLSITQGTSSISFTFNYLIGTYDVSLPSFTTPLGSTDIPIPFAQIFGAGLKARFTAYVSTSVSSSPSGLVSPTSLTYTSATSNSLSISTGTLSSGSISVSSSYKYNGTIEIILSLPLLGDYTVLGPYDISSVTGSDTLSTTVTVNPPPEEGVVPRIQELLSNPVVIILIIVIIVVIIATVVNVAVKRR